MTNRRLVSVGVVTAICFVILGLHFTNVLPLHVYGRQNDYKATGIPQQEIEHYRPPGNSTVQTIQQEIEHYRPAGNSNLKTMSKNFTVLRGMLPELGIPLKNFIELNNRTVRAFVFVLGASYDHFVEARDAVAGIQHHMTGRKILFYDMGLKPKQVNQLKSYCNVEVRVLNFANYPVHVKNLKNYAFKPVIIQECLREFTGCFWFDASVRLCEVIEKSFEQVISTGGFIAFVNTGWFQFRTTHPKLYEFLPPTNITASKILPQVGGTSLGFYRTAKVYKNIVYWWVICALDKACAEPQGAQLRCNVNKKVAEWAGCHRYDQSAVNILALNLYEHLGVYLSRRGVVKIIRKPTKMFTVKQCK